MDWLRRYRLREFIGSNFWAWPALAVFLGIGVAKIVKWLDRIYDCTGFGFTADGAKTLLGASVASLLTFVVVLVSSLLLVVQLVSAQLTPRIIAPTFRSPMIRATLSAFVFSYTLSLTVLGRIGDDVPQAAVAVAITVNVLSIVLFLFFVGSVGMSLRPARVLTSVSAAGRGVIMSIYPTAYDPAHPQAEHLRGSDGLGQASLVVEHARTSGVLLAFDAVGLVALARRLDAVIRLVPRVGDFVATGEPLFKIYRRGNSAVAGSMDDRTIARCLRRMTAFGAERTMEQDPGFAFRIIVDISSKALSPAINDPTTAVLAVDQIHRLLRGVGTRQLHSGRLMDAAGVIRVLFPTPTWEDFVWLAVAEIRQYGAGCLQVCQRLHATLKNVTDYLPEARRAPLREQLRLLDLTIDRSFDSPEDRQRIRTQDETDDATTPAAESTSTPSVPHAA